MTTSVAKLAYDRDLERALDGANRYLARVAPVPCAPGREASLACYRVCLSLCGKFQRVALDEKWVAITAWNRRNAPPWPEDELRRKLRDAARWIASRPPERL